MRHTSGLQPSSETEEKSDLAREREQSAPLNEKL